MRIPILSGAYTDAAANFRVSYPVNYFVSVGQNGISDAYLRPADGLVQVGTGPGVSRGAIEWNGEHYRVMGPMLVKISSSGLVTQLGFVGGFNEPVKMDYSFDRLAIASVGNLYYYDGSTLSQVTDPDLGQVLDVVFVDGYFMTTDGQSIVVTELSNPAQVNPLKYGSSEADPDRLVSILKVRNEPHAINLHTIEAFDNVGGDYFPFQRIEGAQIMKGCVGSRACCLFIDALAFVGSGRGESPSVYIGANGRAQQISTNEIDLVLSAYSDAELANVVLEPRNNKSQQLLYVHLPDRTLVYDATASQIVGAPVWSVLTSTLGESFTQYKARDFVWCHGKWWAGDPTSNVFGTLTDSIGSHWGANVRWEFSTPIVYNAGKGAIIHQIELSALTGRVVSGLDPTLSTSYSTDGVTWSNTRHIKAGQQGERMKRLVWWQNGFMRSWRVQRFQGDTQTHLSVAALEAEIEGLAV